MATKHWSDGNGNWTFAFNRGPAGQPLATDDVVIGGGTNSDPMVTSDVGIGPIGSPDG